MLDRLTVSALLRIVIGIMTLGIVALLAASSWSSWQQLRAAGRMAIVTEASTSAFTAMHNLRTDKASTNKTLVGEPAIDTDMENTLRSYRSAENTAIGAVATLAATIEFADQRALLSELDRLAAALKDVQAASWDAMKKPKAQRPSALARDYAQAAEALLRTLEKLSAQLASAVHHDDALVDQLMSIKDAAWLLREAGGQSALLLSTGLAGHLAPDARQTYSKYIGSTETAWAALTSSTSGMQMSAALTSAMAETRMAYFEPQYLALCERLLNSALAGTAPEVPLSAWSPVAVKRLGTAVALAERALGEANDHSLEQWSAARRALILQLLLLASAMAVGCGMLIAVNRRVIVPLHAIGDAMLKVAAGDLSVNSGCDKRRDEIGALAGALSTFKQHAVEKNRIERLEQERNARTEARQQAVEAYIEEFESHVRDTLLALGDASEQMRITSDDMTAVSSQTKVRVRGAAKASNDALMSVQGVAAASEELSASVSDISRQAVYAAGIASRAVDQARETDSTVLGLAKTANRIGEVVDLISDIAGQTNLLALNATIEAARAGDAGRGFAVVASEVKSLAGQTAKATEDISSQVADIQTVVNEAVSAIKAIGNIIGQVNEVATAIAAAVEEQGAATLEITRNTQQAAGDTRDVSDNIGGVSADADAAGAAAQKVKLASEMLGTQTRHLGAQVTEFLGRIRAA